MVGATNNALGHYNPGVAQDNQGNVYLFWDQNPGIYYVVTNTTNIACTTSCTPRQYSTNYNNYDLHPVPLTLKNGTLLMLFASKRGGTNNFGIYGALYNPDTRVWSSATRITNSAANDQNPSAFQDNTGKLWVSWQRTELGDLKIKYVDPDNNGVWDPGETIVYDSNNSGKYSSGRYYNTTIIYGPTPANNTALTIDPRIGFIDAFGYGIWKPGDFVVYSPDTNTTYDPHFTYVDSNNNGVWSPGETIVYKLNYTVPYFTGTGTCRTAAIPTKDCVIVGPVPSTSALLKSDSHLKFVDLNGDGVWEPGESLVYDVNTGVNSSSGIYTANDIAIVPLTSDVKLRFIGSGTTWTPGSTVVYDKVGNGVYDGRIKFVNATNSPIEKWAPGKTVIFDTNMSNYYDPDSLVIYEASPGADFGKPLRNDPGLRFIDTDGNGVWEPGEAVIYDSSLDGVYDGRLMFVKTGTNTTWVPGETAVYDANSDGRYTSGKFYNDTLIAGTAPANSTVLTTDPKLKFYDIDGDMLWESGEPVVYSGGSTYAFGDPVIYGPTPPVGAGVTTGLGEALISTPSLPAYVPLRNDPKLLFIRAGTNTTWVLGETVVYDRDGNGLYGYGKYDSGIRFVNATTNPTEIWALGKAVVYDPDGDGKFIVGKYVSVNDTIICGPLAGCAGTVANNTLVKTDTKLRFVDCTTTNCDNNNRWERGETVFYDSNGNGVFALGETTITGAPPPAKPVITGPLPINGATLSADPLLKYWDSDGNGVWDSSEAVVYDAGNTGSFQPSYYPINLMRSTVPQSGTLLTYNIGEPWISGPPPVPGASLGTGVDGKIKFVDFNANGHWDQYSVLGTQYSTGEPVIYDVNNTSIYDAGVDMIISGSPIPSIGTPLKTDATTLAGTMAAAGTILSAYDPKMKFVATGTNTTWVPGETVILDQADTCPVPANCRYVSGKHFNDTIIAGTPPANNTGLSTDTKLKYSILKDRVFYDSNNDSIYEAGEPIVAMFQTPPIGTALSSDSNLKYFDSDGNGVWDPGESVVYSSSSTYTVGTTVLAGSVPGVGTVLSADPKIKYVNNLGTTTWTRGETVVYNSAGNGAYNSGEPIIASGNPLPGAPLQVAMHILYKTYSGGSWSQEQRVTALPTNDNSPSITGSVDGKIWVAWDGDRGGGYHQIILRTTRDGVNWAPEQNITTVLPYGDRHPAMMQDRNGTIWIVWSRLVSCGALCLQSNLYMTSSTNNGATWGQPTILVSTAGQSESNPFMVQLSDKNLYTFYTAAVGCAPSCTTVPIYYFASQIPAHSARLNTFTTNAPFSSTLPPPFNSGLTVRSGQVVRLTVNYTNIGDFSDNIRLFVKANSTFVATNSTGAPVAPGPSRTIFVDWLTSGLNPGTYVLTANITITTGTESLANVVDNYGGPINLLIRPSGDVNGDCKVNIIDLVIVAGNFGKKAGDPGFNPLADVNGDGKVNVADFSIVGGSFGSKCPGTP